jgi:ATP-dependent phosphofructokinase / diphosphate-dependent phosphofructokinase
MNDAPAHPIRRIAINTGGGDAPGLNAVIRAATLAAIQEGWEVLGIRRGYTGLLEGEVDGEPGICPLTANAVRGITHLGGTILGTTTRGNPFGLEVRQPDGTWGKEDRSEEIVRRFREMGIDALIAIGGDGSLSIAHELWKKGLPVIGVPKTIDNDLRATDVTFGFQTAVEVATDAIGRLHSTAESHQRVMVVQLMGRHTGWIALESGVAGGADVILIPEIPYSVERIAEKVREREAHGRRFSIVVVAEGARAAGGEPSYADESGRYGGIAERSPCRSPRRPERRRGRWCWDTSSAAAAPSPTTATSRCGSVPRPSAASATAGWGRWWPSRGR